MKIPVYIEIDDDDHTICSRNCLFLESSIFSDSGECLLFNKHLEDTTLPKGWGWNDCGPTQQRCAKCLTMEY